MSSFIDAVFIVSMMISAGYIFQNDHAMTVKARVVTIVFLFFIYEPLCTSKFCTIGQIMTGIRVRSLNEEGKISIQMAYIRIIFKLLLGFISFFTIPFTKHKRAIHDLIVGSVVIRDKP